MRLGNQDLTGKILQRMKIWKKNLQEIEKRVDIF